MKVSFKTLLPTVTAGLLTLTSCETVVDRASKYMINNGKTQVELEEVLESNLKSVLQSKLDSVAYRDI